MRSDRCGAIDAGRSEVRRLSEVSATLPVWRQPPSLPGPCNRRSRYRKTSTRDSATFTTHRRIVRDAQGISAKKVEIYSLPYSAITMWSSENAGTLDWNSEVELWTKAGHIKIKLSKGADVRRLDSLIAWAVLKA